MPILPASGMLKLKVLQTNTPLDKASGIGGLPRGFIVELWGKTNSGKSTIAFQTVAAAQKAGLRCLWIDVEHTFRAYIANPQRAATFGVNMDLLDVMTEENAEAYIDNTEEAIRSKKYDLIVMDSIGDLSSKIEQEKSSGEKTIGTQASLMTKFVRSITWMIDMNEIIFLVVNHERQTLMGGIYQMGGNKLAEKKKMSFRFREKQNFMIKKGERIVGKVMRINVSKNHFAATEGLEIESNLIFNEGFSYAADLLDDAIERGIITKEGNSHFFAGEKIGMIGKAREWIADPLNAERISQALSV
jgi:recombination protein RecA